MPTIISIGYREYLLPGDVNVNTLIKALEGACEVEKHRDEARRRYFYTRGELPEISIEVVPKDAIREPKKPKQIPAQAGPEANGKDYFKPEQE